MRSLPKGLAEIWDQVNEICMTRLRSLWRRSSPSIKNCSECSMLSLFEEYMGNLVRARRWDLPLLINSFRKNIYLQDYSWVGLASKWQDNVLSVGGSVGVPHSCSLGHSIDSIKSGVDIHTG